MDKGNVYRGRELSRDKSPVGGYIDKVIGKWDKADKVCADYKKCVSRVAKHNIVRQMKNYEHHGNTSCYQHSLHVSYYNYLICKKLGLDYKAAARAGMLHDLFLYDWHDYKPRYDERLHGFQHPDKALKNAQAHFKISKKEGDIIKKHMFPLTLTLPKYKETCVIVLTDKFCSMCEVIDGFVRK
ncbi:MAG: HDIG domain-containing protein [Lachnospira sp.]|nr:HDIG domain-containing protein [Lachnospira sp.]